MKREEWSEYAEGVHMGTCDTCDRYTTVVYEPDPYSVEVCPEDGPYPDESWCYECWCSRKDDV